MAHGLQMAARTPSLDAGSRRSGADRTTVKAPITRGLSFAVLLLAGCGDSKSTPSGGAAKGGPAPPAVTAAPAPEATHKPAAQPKPAATAQPAAPQGDYPLSAIRAIPDSCASPAVLLTTAPESAGPSPPWHVTRQAFLANQQFRVVIGAPSAPGEVHLAPYRFKDTAYALVATCKDGGTCNRVAAMYKAIVRSSSPQLVCGKLQGLSASPSGNFDWGIHDPKQNLPPPGDVSARCARISACRIATDRSTPGDPFLECQKAPQTVKTACADRYPCAEVMSCLAK
jgi:hypothetical protein